MTTNVPSPTFSDRGFEVQPESAILDGVIEDWVGAFALEGFNLNLSAANSESLTTSQGQLASSTSAIVSNVQDQFVLFTNLLDPAYTYGRYQDAIGRIYFMQRISGQPTVLQVSCVGLAGTTIPGGPLGALINDPSGNLYQCNTTAQIPVSGSITLPFSCVQPGAGPIAVPASVSIYQAIPGWDTANLISGVVGRNVESRSEFEARRFASVASNSEGMTASVLGAVLAVPGVTSAYVYDNSSNTSQTVGGVTLPANSLYVCVQGGDTSAVAQAIWSKKAPGCVYFNGNVSTTVYDQSPGYSPPYPAYTVSFQTALALPFAFSVVMKNNGLQPANATTLIQQAVAASFAGQDNNVPAQPGVKIGATVFASRFYANVAALGSWAQIIDIQLGTSNAPAASFTASVSGTSMTVTAVASGSLAPNQVIKDSLGNVPAGVTIFNQVSGSPGGTGVYTISQPLTVLSEPIYTIAANLNLVTPNINQMPSLQQPDVQVSFA